CASPACTPSSSFPPALLLPRLAHHPHLHSFPTRRSSDLSFSSACTAVSCRWASFSCFSSSAWVALRALFACCAAVLLCCRSSRRDRKSTRLNSSHVSISYAVFCLKKKIQTNHFLIILCVP